MSYFLASRAVDLERKQADFSIFEISMGKTIKTNPLFNSRGGSLEYWNRIRPVVEIDKNAVILDRTNAGTSPETAWKLM